MFLKAHKKITLLLKAFTLCDCFIELFLDYSGFFDLFANFLCKLLLGLDLFLEFLILIINLLLNGRYLLSSSLKVLLMLFKFFSNHMSFLIHLLPFSFLLLEFLLKLTVLLPVFCNFLIPLRKLHLCLLGLSFYLIHFLFNSKLSLIFLLHLGLYFSYLDIILVNEILILLVNI